jgi:hypothetical protein
VADLGGSVPAKVRSPADDLSIKRSLKLLFWLLAAVLGFLQAWAHRYDMQPDGISYIEIAKNGGAHFVNGYWSPLYPFLLRLTFRIFHPSLFWEATSVHLTNFAIYLVNLVSFEVFLKELIRTRNSWAATQSGQPFVSAQTVWTWGYVFFLWAAHYWVTPAWVTPDLCVAGIVYLIMATMLRIHRGAGSWLTFASLGALLGLGYLAKAPMFVLAFIFLACAAFLVPAPKKAVPLLTTALLFFSLLAGPLVFSLSNARGRPTFGDSGKINYAEYVNGAPKYVHWHGEPPATGIPVHAERQIFAIPPMYEFSVPIPGSYPPWYDPAYWYEGIRPHFAVKGQLLAMYRTSSSYLRIVSVSGTLYAVFLTLLALSKRSQFRFAGLRGERICWPVRIPALAALLMYAFVHVEPRFIGGFLLTALVCILVRVRVSPSSGGTGRTSLPAFASIIVLAPALAIAWPAIRDFSLIIAPESFEQWEVARGLRDRGVSPGSTVGYIGTGLDAYWAHLAQVRIVAEIPESGVASLVQSDREQKGQLMGKFRELGVKGVLTKYPNVAASMEGWSRIPGSRYFLWVSSASPPRLSEARMMQ